MSEIYIGPTICATIAWGCSLNMIMFGAVAVKEGWNVPSVALMSAPRILGKIGMFISMALAAYSAGWWSLLIAPAGGMLFSVFLRRFFVSLHNQFHCFSVSSQTSVAQYGCLSRNE